MKSVQREVAGVSVKVTVSKFFEDISQ